MPHTSNRPPASQLFEKWKHLFANGEPTTATFLAGNDPRLESDLQQMIDDYLARRAEAGTETQTGSPDGRSRPPLTPKIPGYEFERYLGGGGMGEVWLVRDLLNREFALKIVRPDRLSASGRERFLAEGRAMESLNHPHVARIHHFGIFEDLPYFLMRPYPASLKDRQTEYVSDPKSAVRLLAAVAEGVGHLHARGFVHRDLKPGNVLIDQNGQPAVSDFGLVKTLGDDPTASHSSSGPGSNSETHRGGQAGSNTVAGTVMGTRAYMSPDQAAGRTDEANPRWDVWSLGVMLHHMVTGQLPPSSEAPELLLDPATPDNPPPSSIKPGLDPRLDRMIQKCLARDARERYPDGAAVAKEMKDWLDPPEAKRKANRRRTVRTFAMIGLVTAAVVALLAMRPWREQDRKSWLEQSRKTLGRGERLVLIERQKEPRFPEWTIGKDVATVRSWQSDNAYSMDTQRYAYQELLPAGYLPEQYTIRGRVRMNDGAPYVSGIGVAFGCIRLPNTAEEEHFVVSALIGNEVAAPPGIFPGRRAGGGWLQGEAITIIGRPTLSAPRSFKANPVHYFDSPFPKRGDEAPDHEIVVHVRNGLVEATIDQQPAGRVSISEMLEAIGVRATEEFQPKIVRGAIGIVVAYGSGSFLELSVEPVVDP